MQQIIPTQLSSNRKLATWWIIDNIHSLKNLCYDMAGFCEHSN
jgi:hypothetical protein